MAKFKVGDKVRVRKDLEVGRMYGRDFFMPPMSDASGKTLKIESMFQGKYELVGFYNWHFTDEMLEPEHPDQQIHISRDGNTVHAVMKENGKVLKRTKAICAPSDTFDFELGARIAFDRLFEKEAKKEKVFSLKAYFRYVCEGGVDEVSVNSIKNGWPFLCDGKTRTEINEMGLKVSDSWMVEP